MLLFFMLYLTDEFFFFSFFTFCMRNHWLEEKRIRAGGVTSVLDGLIALCLGFLWLF
jgi:hypothetical protein